MTDAIKNDLSPFKGERLWSRAFSQKADAISMATYGVPGLTLMENAGLALVDLARRALAGRNGPLIILAGPGNNGGDALAAAFHLWQDGCQPAVLFHHPPGRMLSASCAHQLQRLSDAGVPITTYNPGSLAFAHGTRPVIIDGLLGSGFRGILREGDPFALPLAEAARIEDRYVIAVDVPSGCDADAWLAPPPLLTADVTLTFGGAKLIHRLAPARSYCGDIVVADIGFHPQALLDAARDDAPCYLEIDSRPILAVNPWDSLSRDASKFDRGHVLVIGGSPGKTGAPLMAALAALRQGCGWATVALPQKAMGAGVALPFEVTYENLFDQGGCIDAAKLHAFCLARKVRSVVVGPGMVASPFNDAGFTALSELNRQKGVFVLFDAGALHALSGRLTKEPFVAARTVVTPHPGEWRRMVPATRGELVDACGETSAVFDDVARWGVTLLYKGATPLALDPDHAGQIAVMTEGGIELAKAGSGDVLAGMIGAHGALGCSARYAAVRSYAHLAQIASALGKRGSRHGILPTDLIQSLAEWA